MEHDVMLISDAVDEAWSFEATLQAERDRLVRFCAILCGDGAAAEDLAQETLLEAWRNRHKLDDRAGTPAWLKAIARAGLPRA